MEKRGAWSKEEDQMLKEAIKNRVSYSEIGLRINRSKNAVANRVLRLGLSTTRQVSQPVKRRQTSVSPYRTCQYIFGDPRNEYHYCGKPNQEGSSYCPEHHSVVYRWEGVDA